MARGDIPYTKLECTIPYHRVIGILPPDHFTAWVKLHCYAVHERRETLELSQYNWRTLATLCQFRLDKFQRLAKELEKRGLLVITDTAITIVGARAKNPALKWLDSPNAPQTLPKRDPNVPLGRGNGNGNIPPIEDPPLTPVIQEGRPGRIVEAVCMAYGRPVPGDREEREALLSWAAQCEGLVPENGELAAYFGEFRKHFPKIRQLSMVLDMVRSGRLPPTLSGAGRGEKKGPLSEEAMTEQIERLQKRWGAGDDKA